MMNLLGDTTIDKNLQRGLMIAGKTMVRIAEEASPSDDTPGVVTQDEKMSILGQVATEVVGSLGN